MASWCCCSPITGGGRLATVTTPIAGSSAAITYTYDALGRGVDQATTNANNVLTTYDALGRVTGVTNALGAFGYGYLDETSRLLNVTYPTGTGMSTSYAYYSNTSPTGTGNGDQRLETITNKQGSTHERRLTRRRDKV